MTMNNITRLSILPVSFCLLISLLSLVSCATANDQAQVEVKKPAMVTAEQWGSQPLPMPEDRIHEPRFITLHHSGVTWQEDSDPYRKIKNLQSWGKKSVEDGGKGWPDLPYHFLIAPDGKIFEGRPVMYEPETNTSYDVRGHIGVLVMGNFEAQRVSPQQAESAAKLVAWLAQEYGVSDDMIRGHKDLAQTDCPGVDFYRYIEDGSFVNWVHQVREGKQPQIDLGEPLEDGPTEMIPMPVYEED